MKNVLTINLLKSFNLNCLTWFGSFSTQIEMMMEKAGNRHLLTVLTYPDAGHLIEPPYSPHFRATNFMLQEMKEKSKQKCQIGSTYLELYFKCVICLNIDLNVSCCYCCCSCHAMGWTDQTTRLRTRGRMEQDISISAAAPLLQFKLCKGQTVVLSFTTLVASTCRYFLLWYLY